MRVISPETEVALISAGYVVIERATRERERREQWADHSQRQYAEEARESAMEWGHRLCDDVRRLEKRCTQLYVLAKEAGVADRKLRA